MCMNYSFMYSSFVTCFLCSFVFGFDLHYNGFVSSDMDIEFGFWVHDCSVCQVLHHLCRS